MITLETLVQSNSKFLSFTMHLFDSFTPAHTQNVLAKTKTLMYLNPTLRRLI